MTGTETTPNARPKKRPRLRATCHHDGSVSFYRYGDGWDRCSAVSMSPEDMADLQPEDRARVRRLVEHVAGR